MDTWYIIVLAVVAVLAVAILIFFYLMGDDTLRLHRMKHKRGEYINDQTAVIYQTIKDLADSEKAYNLFLAYIFANNRHFLSYLNKRMLTALEAYKTVDIAALERELKEIYEMRVELKDQAYTQKDCLRTIDPKYFVGNMIWIRVSTNCRFEINQALAQIARGAIEYFNNIGGQRQPEKIQLVEKSVLEIVDISSRSAELLQKGDVEGMRKLRHHCKEVMDVLQEETTRLYDVINDGHSNLSDNRRLALNYVLNNFRECHLILETLRRLLLCHIGKSLSIS